MSAPSFIYYDLRRENIYQVFLSDGMFHHAHCHVGHVGLDPIVYDQMEELPDGPQHEIEQRIEENIR